VNCAGCRREMEVGDQYIHFAASEFFERDGVKADPALDGLMAEIMGGTGDQLVYCEDCTQKRDDGWLLDTVYGDED
jgi:hypothetical protein